MDKQRIRFFVTPMREGRWVGRYQLKGTAHFYMEAVPVILPKDLPIIQLRDGSFNFDQSADKGQVASARWDALRRLRVLLEVHIEKTRYELLMLERELANDLPQAIEGEVV